MNHIRSMMREAHSQSNKTKETPVKVSLQPAAEMSEPRSVLSSPAPEREKVKRTSSVKSMSTGVAQIARDDLPIESYGVKPVATNFNCYNKELFDWLRNFSSSNQFSGGVAITKSQLIEIALDVIMYDLGINPIGYESQQALREDIQNKIKGM